MTDKKHDSVLVGWADEPNYNDNNELMSWRLRLKDHELKEMLDKYLTIKNEKGGGNAYLTMFMAKSGKACCRVYDPNSEGAKEAREAKQATSVASDLPF
tara:strand:+ start:385 stop:681 length:297 start_codon:yes stop_codon:yes gene_type:complete